MTVKSTSISTITANKSNSSCNTSLQELDSRARGNLTKHAQGKNAFVQKIEFVQCIDAQKFEVEKEGLRCRAE